MRSRVEPLLPANGPILRALSLPPVYGISNAGELGEREFLARLDRALARGLKLVQVREKAHVRRTRCCASRPKSCGAPMPRGARVLVNGDAALAQRAGADGVHLTVGPADGSSTRAPRSTSSALPATTPASSRARRRWARDFAVLGPVQPTPSHPGAAGSAGTRSPRC